MTQQKTSSPAGTVDRLYYPLLSIVSALALVFVWRKAVVLTPDYGSYVAHSIIRPPMLPLLLDLFSTLFGAAHLRAFSFFQTLIMLWAAFAFAEALRKTYATGKTAAALVFAALLSPIITQNLGNAILTETLGYAFFLYALGLVMGLLKEFHPRQLALLAAVIATGTLLRAQLAFLWAAYAVLCAYIFLREKNLRAVKSGAVYLAAALLAVFLLRGAYNYVRHGAFAQLGPGMHLCADLVFVSEPQDVELFREKSYYSAAQEIFSRMQQERLFAQNRLALELPLATFSLQRAANIGQATSYPLYRYVCGSVPGEPGFPVSDGKPLLAMNDIQLDIYKTLRPLHYKDYIRLIASRFTRNISLFELAMFALGLAWLLSSLRRAKPIAPLAELAVFAMFLNTLNIAAVSMVTYVIFRYTFYTQLLELAATIAIADALLNDRLRVCADSPTTPPHA